MKPLREHITEEMLTPAYWLNPENVKGVEYKISASHKRIRIRGIKITTSIQRPRIWLDTRENLVEAKLYGAEAYKIVEEKDCVEIADHFIMMLRDQMHPIEVA